MEPDRDPAPDWARAYYTAASEQSRLDAGPGLLEQERTRELLQRFLPPPPAGVADIGAGPGAYALWLAEQGYRVTARDLMPRHVDELAAAAAERGLALDVGVGDARRLDLPDAAFDAVLLFGPLYHLQDPAGRRRALREAARIVVPGGVVLAVAISRWAVILDALFRLRLAESDPDVLAIVDQAAQSGRLEPGRPGGFSGFLHRPAELSAEVTDAGLHEVALLSIEGAGAYLGNAELEERWSTPAGRITLVDVARRLEAVPELAGLGSHLMIVARRPA